MTAMQPRSGGLDVARIRRDFPIFSRPVQGKRLVFLDSAASAQKPRSVLDAERHVYAAEYANVHRGVYWLSQRATEAYEGAREKVRDFLNAAEAREIVFLRGATEGINLVAQTYGRRFLGPGDEVVVTQVEHHSNIVPWQMLREEKGIILKVAPVDDSGELDLEAFERLLGPRTKLVSIAHVANALGSVMPVEEVIRLAKARGIAVLLDGCQAVPHMPVDVRGLDCDFYVFSGHKLYGPTGIGALYGKRTLLKAMRPFNGGGEMIREVFEDHITYGEPPHKFEAGTPPIVQAIGLGAAIDYVGSLGKARIRAHETELVKYAHQRLREINSLRIFGHAREKGSIVSFEMRGAHPHDVATIIDRSGVAVRAGTHCVMPLLARFGVSATCRASFALYNTKAEVDRLAEALIKAQDFFS